MRGRCGDAGTLVPGPERLSGPVQVHGTLGDDGHAVGRLDDCGEFRLGERRQRRVRAAFVVHPDVEAALRPDDVVLHERGRRRRQQVRHLDLRGLIVRVLDQVEELEVAERRALGEVPLGRRARQDAALGVAAVPALVPGHRPVGHDLHVGFDQRRELGGLEAGDALDVDGRPAHRRQHAVVTDGEPVGALEARQHERRLRGTDWRWRDACRRSRRSRPLPGT